MSDSSSEIIKTDTTEIIKTDTIEIIKRDTTEIIKTDTIEIIKRDTTELQVLFKAQAEWYRLNGGTCLCDCINCISARKVANKLI